jgi:CheY-like chemotaxis protein
LIIESKAKNELTDRNIAIVENNETLRKLLHRIIVELGYPPPFLFPSGTSLLHSMANDHQIFDIILMDSELPDIDGIEAAKVIRRRRFKTKITMISGFDLVSEKALANGFRFLSKPFSVGDLDKNLQSSFEELETIQSYPQP